MRGGLGEFETVRQTLHAVEGLLNCPKCLDEVMEAPQKKKSSIAFIKYFSKIIQQMKENAVF